VIVRLPDPGLAVFEVGKERVNRGGGGVVLRCVGLESDMKVREDGGEGCVQGWVKAFGTTGGGGASVLLPSDER
jgi:hypothetical protein